MHILVIGTGYVGLVTGACFAKMGHSVTCLDIDAKKIAKLQQGYIPIYEPKLEDLVKEGLHHKTLSFTTDYSAAVEQAEVIVLTLPTPSKHDGTADLSYLESSLHTITHHMHSPKLFIIKSTVPPGTAKHLTALVQTALYEKKLSFDLISNPEFLREGSAVEDCMHPERVIIGSHNPQTYETMKALYSTIPEHKLLMMDLSSAEMTKYAANAMLAARISFMNELAGLCEKVDANIEQVRLGIGSDSRIGPHFLHAGVGFGGSCFPKDIKALQAKAKQLNHPTPILNAIEAVNATQKKILGEKIRKYFAPYGGVKGKTIAIWGLAFKPNTDDMREAPSLELIKELRDLGAKLRVFDPVAMENAKEMLEYSQELAFCQDEYEASHGADAIALLTEWKQFQETNLEHILQAMSGKALFDGRNQYTKEKMQEKGFEYFGIGIPEASP